jgi:DNA invertase Pin-like site-specific DNA recombinase
MSRSAALPPIAFSYLRFSSKKQGDGDSIRRQEELRDDWIAKEGAVLDSSLNMRDEGVSAFTGQHRINADRNCLAAFLELVRRGRIPRGSYLVVESLDRLSREHIRPALTLLLNLIDAGVKIVQLLPVEAVFDEKVEPMQLMMAIMELSRGHSESAVKSRRVGDAWRRKKAQAATDKKPITRRVPGWLRVRDRKFVLDDAKAEVVRRIFRMAAEGYGLSAITKRLNAETVPPIGASSYWQRGYVTKLLGMRSAVGEYQPHAGTNHSGRKPDGPPIANYFPAVVTEDEWYAARAAMTSRRNKGGRPTKRMNLFANLLRDARNGGGMYVHDKHPGKSRCVLIGSQAEAGVRGTRAVSFPHDVFERAVLSHLREIDPREILPGNGAAERVQTLTGKLADIEGRAERIKAQMVDGEDVGLDVLRTLERKRVAAAEDLARAKREAASPLSAAWGDYRSLVDVLEGAPDPVDARTRLRAALRRMTEAFYCLFVGRGEWRVAAVQAFFTGGARRSFVILHRPAKANKTGTCRPAEMYVRSFAGQAKPDDLDLRRRKDAKALEGALEAVDVDTLGLDGTEPPKQKEGTSARRRSK